MKLCKLLLLATLLCLACSKGAGGSREILLATTTSTQDSGLLDELLPHFEKEKGLRVKVVAVGTGEALAMGERGDADVLLVHARKAEDDFMARGLGSLRLDVMHNDFLLVGPSADPAGARNADVSDAFARIAKSAAPFASRGDRSGTHKKQQELWKAAGIAAEGQAWYLSAGQGMGETLRLASEKHAYTLVDRGTWLAQRNKVKLQPIAEGDPRLFNPYGVIVVNPARFPKVNAAGAEALARWLVAPETQRRIGAFGVNRFGQPLFFPDANSR